MDRALIQAVKTTDIFWTKSEDRPLDAVKVGQQLRVGEEDGVVEECLRHQCQTDKGAPAFDAEKRFGDVRKRREATRSQPCDRKRSIIETMPARAKFGLDALERAVGFLDAA